MVRLEYKAIVTNKYVLTLMDGNIYINDFLFISKFLKFIEFSKLKISRYFEIKFSKVDSTNRFYK